ncbi:MAG: glutamate-5-semialdehyde dehydrogenase [Nanoarchaeota archaeon]|nr:glutamate-5-semialdehyde dehydrogenase [Nanoarchaeota archaeon]MBU1004883.1 glutamate-5-semialdehyde dehydrogenase [Nanoarchaeota archaeon]MBU1945406.1 glutamate-5-semialdehyde dehydrogenase [Nanoarchaeota archaeon]
MTLKTNVLEQCENAKEASLQIAGLTNDDKNFVLYELAEDILMNKNRILKANALDVSQNKGKISDVLLKRLKVDESKIKEMAEMVKSVANLEDPVNKVIAKTQLDKGLLLKKITVPIGVICCIFESRPEVVVQISALAIKSGNAVLLKGGSEALNTNKVLVEIIRESIKDNKGMPEDAVLLLETREAVKEVLKMDEFIDLIIPRGSNKFVKFIQDNTKIPVMGHAEGICHVYVDKDADVSKAAAIAFDAKCQYPAVCNAMETLLVNERISDKFLPLIVQKYLENNVEVRLDKKAFNTIKSNNELSSLIKNKNLKKLIKKAVEKDWKTEYTDLIISIKIVKDVVEAIDHINKYGSGHTDAIVTENKAAAERFMSFVDSASVMWNASTRFADGFRYGLGAEVGISTNKIHARGPVGLEGLVIYKYVLIGSGHIVDEYVRGKKNFLHDILPK